MTHTKTVNIGGVEYECEFELLTCGGINEVLLVSVYDEFDFNLVDGTEIWNTIERELQLDADDFAQDERESTMENYFNREDN